MKFSLAILACILAASAVQAQPQVKITDLGMPTCAAFTPTPSFVANFYVGDQHDNQRINSPWSPWPPFYNQHAQFNGLIGNQYTTSTAKYVFATPQTEIKFVIGNPPPGTYLEFYNLGQDTPIAFIIGAALGSARNVMLSLTGGATFDAFTFALAPPQEATLSYANFNAVCK